MQVALRTCLQVPSAAHRHRVAPLRAVPTQHPRQAVVVACSPRTAIRFREHGSDVLPAPDAATAHEERRAGEAAAVTSSSRPPARPRVVVIGSGWSSMSLVKALPADISDAYDLVLLSPRNYFLYTPLLPAVAAGAMEERSIVEPVRSILAGKGTYYEAQCTKIDPVRKEVSACFPRASDGACTDPFTLSYDLLIVAAGSVNNTFGTPDVAEHCCFLKSLEDAHALRRRVSDCFERAALPNASESDRRQLLSFVVCGGGPSGVEVAAELHDMVHHDLAAQFPALMPHVTIRLVEMQDRVLTSYSPSAGAFAASQFEREGVELLLNSRVLRVSERAVTVADKAGSATELPCGVCIWVAGVGPHPLVHQLQQAFPDFQKNSRCALTDGFLRAEGSDGSVLVLGDAASIHTPLVSEYADELFAEADADGDGLVGMSDLRTMLHDNARAFPQLARHALAADVASNRFTRVAAQALFGQPGSTALAALEAGGTLDRKAFAALLHDFDSGLHALPQTAQVAAQQGQFVAGMLRNAFDVRLGTLDLSSQKPFKYFHKGSLAYVGDDQAIMDAHHINDALVLTGAEANAVWHLYETVAQISPRNMLLVLQNFVRNKVWGRDTSSL